LDKCDLLCANCHVLEHTDLEFFKKFEKLILDKVEKYKEPKIKLDRNVVLGMYMSGKKQSEIAKFFNTSKSTICCIIKKYKAEKRGLDPQSI
jgi:DNA invertase Pin-like site-specific DNA recombinase